MYYRHQSLWFEPAIAILVLTLPPSEMIGGKEPGRFLRRLGMLLSIVLIVAGMLTTWYAVTSDLAGILIAFAGLAWALGLAALAGTYFRIRVILIGVGLLFLTICLVLFHGAIVIGPILLPLAISLLISGLAMPRKRSLGARFDIDGLAIER